MMRKLYRPLFALRIVRYLAAGGTAFVVDYATLLILTEGFGVYYLWSATAGFILGGLVCYRLSLQWVFEERRFDRRSSEVSAFLVIGIIGLGLNNLLLWLLTDGADIPYQYGKLFAAGLIVIFNYYARLYIVFTSGAGQPGPR